MTATQYPISSWLTFRSVQIPVGSIINKATITFTCFEGDESSTVNVDITGHLTANSTTNPSAGESNYPFNHTTWARTSTVVNWEMGSWSTDNTYTTPDVACIIQEIIDAGWTQGNALKFFFDDGGVYSGANAHKAKDYTENSSETAQLKLWYSPAYSETGTGGVLIGGEVTVTQLFSYNETADGGFLIGGSATVTQLFSYSDTMTGGFLIGGEADVHIATTYFETMVGGMVLGSAPFSNGYRYRQLITVPAGAVSQDIQKYYLGVRADLPVGHLNDGTVRVEDVTPSVTWVPSSDITITGNNMAKTSGTAGWNAGSYSIERFLTNCYASVTVSNLLNVTMFGLGTAPTLNNNYYAQLDYAIYLSNPGLINIYEMGANIGSFGSCAVNDVMSIKYDGTNVIYCKNSTVLRTVSRAVGLPLHFVSSFYTVSLSHLTNCKFGSLNFGNNVEATFGSEMLTNTTFTGYAAGSPGTVPTGWYNLQTTGSLAAPTLTFDATSARRAIYQTFSVSPGIFKLEATVTLNSGSALFYDAFYWAAPGSTTAKYFINNTEVTSNTSVSGTSQLRIELTVIISGTLEYRIGTGIVGTRTQNITITKPSLKYSPGYLPVVKNIPNELRKYDAGTGLAHVFFKTPLKALVDNNFYLYYGK